MDSWLAIVTKICRGQASFGIIVSQMGIHPGSWRRIIALHKNTCSNLINQNFHPPIQHTHPMTHLVNGTKNYNYEIEFLCFNVLFPSHFNLSLEKFHCWGIFFILASTTLPKLLKHYIDVIDKPLRY